MTDIPQILDQLISQARHAQASDIHIQPYPSEYRIRFRIDGTLSDHQSFEYVVATQLCARIKVLSQLDVSEKRRPQDGSFSFQQVPYACDIRVATFPAQYGEKIVLRLLDNRVQGKNLDQLGLSPIQQELLSRAVAQESGCIILTGPTGSGKTTTAHALALTLDASQKNIVSLEDPIEYMLPGVTQTTVQPILGITFEAGLRALLRQDPDVILIGEIRDAETAQVALQAALTGHQVITTLHTTDALSALIRLVHLGSNEFLIASAVQIIVAQRLARKVCLSCTHTITHSMQQLELLNRFDCELTYSAYGTGCEHCRFTGYLGRVGIFEILSLTPTLRAAFSSKADPTTLQSLAYTEGMVPLIGNAIAKLCEGHISFEEWSKIAGCF